MQFACEHCSNVFDENEKNEEFSLFGSLRSPCQSTYKICKHVDKYLNFYDIRRSSEKYDFQVVYCLVFRTDFNTLFKSTKFDCDVNHKYQLIKWIVRKYIEKKSAYISKEMTLDQYQKIFRHQLNKLVLFAGQYKKMTAFPINVFM